MEYFKFKTGIKHQSWERLNATNGNFLKTHPELIKELKIDEDLLIYLGFDDLDFYSYNLFLNNLQMNKSELAAYDKIVKKSEKTWRSIFKHPDRKSHEFWFYGFWGGSRYGGGVFPNEPLENNLNLFKTVAPINSVDALFKQHDYNGIDKTARKFIDINSEQALISHYALVEQLTELINSFKITEPVSDKSLSWKRLRDAWRAAGQAKLAFEISVIKIAARSFREKKGFSKEKYNKYIKEPEFRNKIEKSKKSNPEAGF